MNEYKILLTGTTGAGKTTAIAAISETAPVRTDVKNNDTAFDKATTTVGLDYGELTLDNGDKLRLYGTPGQERFSFMWRILAQGALGIVVLIDNARPDPLADLAVYLQGFKDLIRDAACVVGVGRMETHPEPGLDAYAEALHAAGVLCPLLPVDVREQQQVLMLMDLLLTQFESKSPAEGLPGMAPDATAFQPSRKHHDATTASDYAG
ncbi:GTP-binding protein [Polaromonas sp. SM01]|uniref:GTP-binding protein n=1 Tax=Polaromonas sp. SM01 TaxID=3085630 RepID=UPI002980DF88|nr:ATP/GTP-binding protein [Polaromonas sp. SM01]MDW5441181.1 ATP/GTP-binding protein [Polaromonas sp. SM01]